MIKINHTYAIEHDLYKRTKIRSNCLYIQVDQKPHMRDDLSIKMDHQLKTYTCDLNTSILDNGYENDPVYNNFRRTIC